MPQFPLKDDLSHEEKGEREDVEEEDSCLKLCAPHVATFQSPLQKTFRSTDTVGKSTPPAACCLPPASLALASGLERTLSLYHQVAAEDLQWGLLNGCSADLQA